MRFFTLIALAAVLLSAQQNPDVAGQREAMKKLAFLVGKWSGDASVVTGRNGPIRVRQTEEVQFKLNGLVLLIEGTGRDPSTGEVVFTALATVSYDSEAKAYKFRSFNDGRYLDTELKVTPNGFEWGYTAGPATIRYTMRLNEKGQWYETGQAAVGDSPARQTFEMTATRQ